MIRLLLFGLAGLPGLYWAARGMAGVFLGLGPGFGPGSLAAVWALGLFCALGWVYLPAPAMGPDGLLEPPADTTKALLPVGWRGELCSSIVSNQS